MDNFDSSWQNNWFVCLFLFFWLVGSLKLLCTGWCHSCLNSKRARGVLVHLWRAYHYHLTGASLLCFQPFDYVTCRAFVFTIAYHQFLASNFGWLELIPVVFGLFCWFLDNPKVKWFQAFSVLMIIHDFTHSKSFLLIFLSGCGLWCGC